MAGPTPSAPPPVRRRRSRATGRLRIEDVARIAGVSAQTVSRYLREPASVAAPTTERIRAAIEETGYVPNLVAGSLASNKSRIVAIIVPTLANPGHAAPVQGLSDVVGAAGYQVLVGSTGYSRDTERDLVAAFLGRRVDGLVITGGRLDPSARDLIAKAGLPTVQLYELPAEPVDMAVGFSNSAAGEAVAAHLAERGYRRPTLITHAAPADTRAAARVTGFIAAAERLGLRRPTVLAVDSPANVARGHEALDRLLAAEPATDAVFAVSDLVAVGIALACQKRGIAVPQRLAIVGFGDIDVAAALVPPLTTVRIPRYQLGEIAGKLLLARFAGETVAEPIVDVGFDLVVRGSS